MAVCSGRDAKLEIRHRLDELNLPGDAGVTEVSVDFRLQSAVGNLVEAFDRLVDKLNAEIDGIQMGDAYSIHSLNFRRWNGDYKVVAIDGPDITLRNLATGQEDSMRAEFLRTWPRIEIELAAAIKEKLVAAVALMNNSADIQPIYPCGLEW